MSVFPIGCHVSISRKDAILSVFPIEMSCQYFQLGCQFVSISRKDITLLVFSIKMSCSPYFQ